MEREGKEGWKEGEGDGEVEGRGKEMEGGGRGRERFCEIEFHLSCSLVEST